MPSVVVRDMPATLHRRLKAEAARHHRSMNREIIAIIEEVLAPEMGGALPPPVKGRKRVDGRWVSRAIRNARDGNR